MQINENEPIYSMGVAANLLDVHPRTLRIYEAEGLISPHRKGGKRFFSKNDIQWVECIRKLIHDENISIQGIKKLLEYAPCWKIKNCSTNEKNNCSAFKINEKNCWEHAQKACEKSCKCCEVFVDENSN